MPYAIRKVRNKNCYSVKNSETGKLKSSCASLKNAKSQVRLLNAIEHGWKPSPNYSRKKNIRDIMDNL